MLQSIFHFPSLRGFLTRSNLHTKNRLPRCVCNDIRIKLILLICCCINLALAQVVQQPNVPPLDAKNGINKFKLCSFYDIHKANLKETPAQKDVRIKWYTYTGTDVPTVFEYKVKQINLGYYKNKLYKITVLFDEAQAIKTDDIKNKLILLFGEGKYEQSADAKHLTEKDVWETLKVYLSFEVKGSEISIYCYSKIMEKQYISDEL
jgi:hypothetical protein